MAGSLNKVMLIGNLGADPEIRSFQNGGKVANLRIATSETWKDRNTGERQERTEWHTVAIFSEGLVNVVERFLKKGSKVYIEGKLQTRKWQDQNGQDRYSTEVVLRGFDGTLTMLDGAQGGSGGGGGGGQGDEDEWFYDWDYSTEDTNEDDEDDTIVIGYDPDTTCDCEVDIMVIVDVYDNETGDWVDGIDAEHTIYDGEGDWFEQNWTASEDGSYDFQVSLYDEDWNQEGDFWI